MDHRDRTSFTEARSSTMFVFLFVCLLRWFFEFCRTLQARVFDLSSCNFYQQSPRSNLKSCMELGGWDPLRGFFCPLKTPQLRKKVAVNHAKLCETYSPWSNKSFGDKFWTRDTPEWNWPKCSEEFRENGRVEWQIMSILQAIGRCRYRSVVRSGIAVVTLQRLADCEQPNIDYRSLTRSSAQGGRLFSIIHKWRKYAVKLTSLDANSGLIE